jgi:hypothetical protein
VLAVLLYLLRRPSGTEHAESDAATAPSTSASAAPPVIVRTKVEPPKTPPPSVKVATVQHVKCGASPKLTSGPDIPCDSLPFFEGELTRAIEATVDCAPKEAAEGSINYVMLIDFRSHDLKVYPGKSGTWRGKGAKKAADCVKKALAAPIWDRISHQYRWYAIAALATYPPVAKGDGLPDFK